MLRFHRLLIYKFIDAFKYFSGITQRIHVSKVNFIAFYDNPHAAVFVCPAYIEGFYLIDLFGENLFFVLW